MQVERPLSDCCQVEIINKPSKYSEHGYDHCSKCNRAISYALVGWHDQESMGVFEKQDGTWWFFWQQVSTWQDVLEMSHQKYVGQVKHLVNTIGLIYNTQDVDMLSYEDHKRFSNTYKAKVKNPEWAL